MRMRMRRGEERRMCVEHTHVGGETEVKTEKFEPGIRVAFSGKTETREPCRLTGVTPADSGAHYHGNSTPSGGTERGKAQVRFGKEGKVEKRLGRGRGVVVEGRQTIGRCFFH